jgi:glycosyltransferase involved in cell wall biosynthesis
VAEEEEGEVARRQGLQLGLSSRLRAVRISLADPVSYTMPYDASLAEALARRGHDVDFLCASFMFSELAPPDGYRRKEIFFTHGAWLLRRYPRSSVRFLVKGIEYLPNARRLRTEIARIAPDVLHVQWLGLPRVDLRWLEASAKVRPVVFTAHDVLPRRTEKKVELWRRVFATIDRVVVHGEGAVDEIEALGVDRGKIVRIPHPVFPPPPGRELRPPTGSTLLFFGLIRASKGLDLLVRALPLVADQVPDVRLVVAGDPVEMVEPVQKLARDLGVADRIDWRLRFVPDAEIPDLLEEATVVVLPYRKIESSGVLATALGYGRPVVVTAVGSLGETVREFHAGMVAHPDDPVSLAASCVALLQSKEALADAVHGTETARTTLTWERAAEAHERLYAELVAERAA